MGFFFGDERFSGGFLASEGEKKKGRPHFPNDGSPYEILEPFFFFTKNEEKCVQPKKDANLMKSMAPWLF